MNTTGVRPEALARSICSAVLASDMTLPSTRRSCCFDQILSCSRVKHGEENRRWLWDGRRSWGPDFVSASKAAPVWLRHDDTHARLDAEAAPHGPAVRGLRVAQRTDPGA